MLRSPARNLILGVAWMAVVMIAATIAYVAAGWSLADAAYMVVITVFTVGFTEVRPIDTGLLRAITMADVVLGCTGMIFLTGALVQFITLNQLRDILGIQRMNDRIGRLTDHVIICGMGRIGLQLAHELAAARAPFVVLDLREARMVEAHALGFMAMLGDATDEGFLRTAGIDRARAVVTVLPTDAANVFITLSARSLNPSVEIIARGELPSTERKLLHAGANRVVLPTHIGAERIAEIILYQDRSAFVRGGAQMETFEATLRGLGLNVDVVAAAPGSPAVGRTVQALEREAGGAFFVVQINRHDGAVVTSPEGGTIIGSGDGLVLIGRALGNRALFETGRSPNDPLR